VPMTPSGPEGVDRARIIDSIYESAELGHEITIHRPTASTESTATAAD
jgi:hypothetical protein